MHLNIFIDKIRDTVDTESAHQKQRRPQHRESHNARILLLRECTLIFHILANKT